MIKLVLAIFFALFSSLWMVPVLAGLFDRPPGGPGKTPPGGKPAVGAPGPLAGAGLGFLAAGGGYLVLRYRRRRGGSDRS